MGRFKRRVCGIGHNAASFESVFLGIGATSSQDLNLALFACMKGQFRNNFIIYLVEVGSKYVTNVNTKNRVCSFLRNKGRY